VLLHPERELKPLPLPDQLPETITLVTPLSAPNITW
jgi:hypothetical protein